MLYALRTVAVCAMAATLMTAVAMAKPNTPIVVVYPMTTTGIGDDQAGERIASLISQELEAGGRVETRDPSPETPRQNYLETARKLGADYYVTGFVTMISGQLAVVEQVVSTLSNTTVWSNNARLLTNEDARAQGDLVRDAVIGHTGRSLVAFDLGRNAPLAGKAAAPTAAATATPPPVKPSFAVLLTGGNAAENDRAYADSAIVNALRARGLEADLIDDPEGDLSILGPAICASTGARLLLGGTLALEMMPDREINQWATAKIDVAGYDCSKNRHLGVNSGSAGTYNSKWSIDQSVAAALKNFARD
jgi:hypothetical protein